MHGQLASAGGHGSYFFRIQDHIHHYIGPVKETWTFSQT